MPVSAPRFRISWTASRDASVAFSETSIARRSFSMRASAWRSGAMRLRYHTRITADFGRTRDDVALASLGGPAREPRLRTAIHPAHQRPIAEPDSQADCDDQHRHRGGLRRIA